MSIIPDISPVMPSSQVAPLLPSTAEPPLAARRIGFVKAFLLFWVRPRTYGPHLAVGSLTRALGAHVLALVLSGLVIALTAALIMGGLDFHHLRTAWAEQVLDLAVSSVGTPISWIAVAVAVGAIPLCEMGLILLAILLMPWCADGDSAKSVFWRSVKNVYWTTTVVLPYTVFWSAAVVLINSNPAWLRSRQDVVGIVLILLGFGGSLALMVRMLVVGASRYVGDPKGPAFRPREPHCDDCGYLIVGLALTQPCPECALPVSESLPGGRRQPTDWQKSELDSSGFADLLRTQRRVLSDPSFFKRLPVQNGLRTSRHFWWGTFMLIVFVSLCFVRLVLFLGDDSRFVGLYPVFAIVIMLLPIVAQLLMMFGACLWSQVAYGIRDYRVAATTCYYASPLMWPGVLILLLTTVLFAFAQPGIWYDRSIAILEFRLTLAELLLLCAGVLLVISGVFWWRRLARALRDVRYANV